jgi:CRISPR system Cascade subunit CasC
MKFVELHIIQNFAPACLNRDDTNTPKDCMFGGVRRARISSQCVKRSIRQHFMNSELEESDLGVRTKRLMNELAKQLESKFNKEIDDKTMEIIESALSSQKISVKDDMKTQYILYLGNEEISSLAKIINDNWEQLKEISQNDNKDGKNKKEKKKSIPKEITDAIKGVFTGKKASDIAMFGRMVADAPKMKVDAACQVAHAISTHRVNMEMDFFTAVDDLIPDDTTGADMMGSVEFNSACFYRYAVIDWNKLKNNLGEDNELAKKTVEAFIKSAVESIPTGKQNTFAAQNPPSFVMAVVRDTSMPWSLANAYEKPIQSDNNGYIAKSIEMMDDYWGKLKKIYSSEKNDMSLTWISLDNPKLKNIEGNESENISDLISSISGALS